MSRKWMLFLVSILLGWTFMFCMDKGEAERFVKEAVAKEETFDGQIKVLIGLAWFDKSVPPEVSSFAIEEIKGNGRWAKYMLNKAIVSAPASIQKEMIPILHLAYDEGGTSHDLDYISTFHSLLKTGDRDIKIMAMDAFAKYSIQQGVLPIIDAVTADPSLLLHAIKTLGSIASPVSARFLVEQLSSNDRNIADATETSLSRMAAVASLELKKGLSNDSRIVRERCLRIFLPISTVDDIPLLHHVKMKKERFDPELLEQLEKKIVELEEQKILIEQMEQEEQEEGNVEMP
ncbi:MAG: hypothetical protein AB1756_09650 [Acidobacteriota bacterium]